MSRRRHKNFIKEARQLEKYNEIHLRINKELLRKESGNFEIDSIIGRKTDKQVVLSLIDISTGDFYCALYDRSMKDFAKSLQKQFVNANLKSKL